MDTPSSLTDLLAALDHDAGTVAAKLEDLRQRLSVSEQVRADLTEERDALLEVRDRQATTITQYQQQLAETEAIAARLLGIQAKLRALGGAD